MLCACGCGMAVKKGPYAPGHHWRGPQREDVKGINEEPSTAGVIIDGRAGLVPPPPHPQTVDRGKWRIAEEPVGTDLTIPWEPARCDFCRELMWRHNPKADVCESCLYMLYDESTTKQIRQNRIIAQNPIDPFRYE